MSSRKFVVYSLDLSLLFSSKLCKRNSSKIFLTTHVKKSERVGVLGCKGTILVEFSAIRNKKSVSKRQRGAKKKQKKEKAAPQKKKRTGSKEKKFRSACFFCGLVVNYIVVCLN